MQKRKYDKIAEKYGGYNDITEWEFGFNEVVKQLDFKNKVILDYGCGNAKFDRYLLDRGAKRCIGVDNSKEMINIAKKQKTPFLDLYVIKGNKLNFIKSNSIDTAVINWVLCTIQKKKEIVKILKEISRCLKKNAFLIILEPNPKSIGKNFVSWISESIKTKKSGEPYKVYLKEKSGTIELPLDYYHSIKDYTEMLKKAGFKKINFKEPIKKRKNKKIKWIDELKVPPCLIIKSTK